MNESNIKNKSLTGMYTLHQCLYWCTVCCLISFAATYLTEKGFAVSTVGIILFSSNMLSFFVQLFLANIADRGGNSRSIKTLMVALASVSLTIILIMLIADLPMWLTAVLYVPMVACFDMELPLMNSIVVFYGKRNYNISYGIARAFGAAAFGAASFGMGYAIKGFGSDIMLISAIVFAAAYVAMAFAYPKAGRLTEGSSPSNSLSGSEDETADGASGSAVTDPSGAYTAGEDLSGDGILNSKKEPLPIGKFIVRYKWYVLSLLGVMMFGAAHLAVENYMIEIVRPLGGDSSNVGTALMIATFLEMPITLVAVPIYKKLGAHKTWMLIGISYTIRMLLYAMAGSIGMVYIAQCLQMTSYSLVPPSQLYYSKDCVDDLNLVKGQSTSTAAYSLGNALGNLFGGLAVSAAGVSVMLWGCTGGAFLGLVIVTILVPIAVRDRSRH